jgi:hypothetical protein
MAGSNGNSIYGDLFGNQQSSDTTNVKQNVISQNMNKLFVAGYSTDKNNLVSKVRINREYLLSKKTASELNTYLSFTGFPVFTDTFDSNKSETEKYGSLGVRSIFNKSGAVLLGSNLKGKIDPNSRDSEWRLSNNVPLMDNPYNRRTIKQISGCSVKELVEASQKGFLGRETYDYSDFMYCKHLGKMSNNYLITLRRFPVPVDDYISSMGITDDVRSNKNFQSQNVQSVGCLVTWMGTPGNEMSNLLKYTVSMPFKPQEAEWQDGADADSQTKTFNGIAAMFDGAYRKQYMSGHAGGAANVVLGRFFPNIDAPPYSVRDFHASQDKNKVYGPVDAIKSTYMRSEEGLKFDQDITVTFDYELRSYNGINGRQAFLDLLSNILMVTYSTGTFWGGGYKGTGAHQNNIFTNLNLFKANGGVSDYINAIAKDYTTVSASIGNIFPKTLGEAVAAVKNAFNQLGGMIIAGHLNKFGRPHKVMLNSLLSPAPVGFWHLTIGNPHHPIMSIGNMILKQTTIEHYGPLGLDDFPTGIKVTCELTRGKPRDVRDIEKLYMHGNDRIYHSMGPKVFDMYTNAKEYKNDNFNIKFEEGDPNITIGVGNDQEEIATISDISNMSKVLQKYFGHTDTYSIYVAASEQEYGASSSDKSKKQQ